MAFLTSIKKTLPWIKGGVEEIKFQSHGELTIGAEVELQIIDPHTLNLVSKAEILLKAGNAIKNLKREFYLSTLEINTNKCQDAIEIEQDLSGSLDALEQIGNQHDVIFSTTGCHPFSRYSDCVITPSPRYSELIDRNQWLSRRMTVYGLHVHLGMKTGDDCIRFNNFFLQFIPHLLALSASSPFWQGEDTGLASCRPTTYEALPTAGQPYQVSNWREFEQLYCTLKKCNAIRSMRDLWWDMRPSPAYGTLEIRVCDGLATLKETAAVTAYIHLLAHWFNDNGGWIEQMAPPSHWLARENKWRVMRYGLDAQLVIGLDGSTRSVRDDIELWLEKLSGYAETMKYGAYVATVRDILAKGNSSQRQRAIYEESGSLKKVVKHNIDEFTQRKPVWSPPRIDHNLKIWGNFT